MDIALSILKEFFGYEDSATKIATQLTQHGIEVEQIISFNRYSDQIKTARVIKIASDSTQGVLVTVSLLDEDRQITITSGLSVQIDKTYAWMNDQFATPTMLGWSSLKEALEIPQGQTFDEAWQTDDMLLTLSVTPNRGDCLNYLGIARELFLSQRTCLDTQKTIETIKSKFPYQAVEETSNLFEHDRDVCRSYGLAQVKLNSPLTSLPFWMHRFLIKHGLAPSKALVDIGHMVMLLIGQPLHTFDTSKLTFPLTVKKFESLDADDVALLTSKKISRNTSGVGIFDQNCLQAVAGILGAMSSSISDATCEATIESAYFEPKAIRLMRPLGFASPSSLRFERGIDSQLQKDALDLYLGLVQAADSAAICFSPNVSQNVLNPHIVSTSLPTLGQITGQAIPSEEVSKIMIALGGSLEEGRLSITRPSWRHDLMISVDLCEEVVRLYGLDALVRNVEQIRLPSVHIARTAIEKIVEHGFYEVVSYSFIKHTHAQSFTQDDLIKIANPITQDLAVMRPRIWPSLLEIAARNIKFGHQEIRLVEQAPIYDNSLPLSQKEVIAGLLWQGSGLRHWLEKPTELDYYAVKALIENLLQTQANLSIRQESLVIGMHPQLQASIYCDDKLVGTFGLIHPALAQEYEWPNAWLFEIDEEIFNKKATSRFQMFSKMPKIKRDLALVIPADEKIEKIKSFISSKKDSLLQYVHVFDYYSGEHVKKGHVSLGMELGFQHMSKTLDDREIDNFIQQLLMDLNKYFGITLRD